MKNRFNTIICDPPWTFSDSLSMSDVPRGAEANYPLLTVEELKKLPVAEVADPGGCVLALWTPSSLLQEGLDLMNAWGFHQKQTIIWVKNKKLPLESLGKLVKKSLKSIPDKDSLRQLKSDLLGLANGFNLDSVLSFYMGRLFRNTHEIALIGTNSNGVYKNLKNKSQRTVFFGENLKHSAKPDSLHKSLEIMFPAANRLELFARSDRAGWSCFGNEIGLKEDIRDSLQKLIGAEDVEAA